MFLISQCSVTYYRYEFHLLHFFFLFCSLIVNSAFFNFNFHYCFLACYPPSFSLTFSLTLFFNRVFASLFPDLIELHDKVTLVSSEFLSLNISIFEYFLIYSISIFNIFVPIFFSEDFYFRICFFWIWFFKAFLNLPLSLSPS